VGQDPHNLERILLQREMGKGEPAPTPKEFPAEKEWRRQVWQVREETFMRNRDAERRDKEELATGKISKEEFDRRDQDRHLKHVTTDYTSLVPNKVHGKGSDVKLPGKK